MKLFRKKGFMRGLSLFLLIVTLLCYLPGRTEAAKSLSQLKKELSELGKNVKLSMC